MVRREVSCDDVVEAGDEETNLALGEQELHAPSGVGLGDGVIVALFVVAHGVEAAGGRARSGPRGCRRG